VIVIVPWEYYAFRIMIKHERRTEKNIHDMWGNIMRIHQWPVPWETILLEVGESYWNKRIIGRVSMIGEVSLNDCFNGKWLICKKEFHVHGENVREAECPWEFKWDIHV
jgi:hypothetical protein